MQTRLKWYHSGGRAGEALMLQRVNSSVTLHRALHPHRNYSWKRFLHVSLGSPGSRMWAHGAAWLWSTVILDCSSATENVLWWAVNTFEGDTGLGKLLPDGLWKLFPCVVPRGRAAPLGSCWPEPWKEPRSLFVSCQVVDISNKRISGRKKGHSRDVSPFHILHMQFILRNI